MTRTHGEAEDAGEAEEEEEEEEDEEKKTKRMEKKLILSKRSGSYERLGKTLGLLILGQTKTNAGCEDDDGGLCCQ
ncbi:hypothetical protein ACMFMF_008080 [Clarireedia jacksonii]